MSRRQLVGYGTVSLGVGALAPIGTLRLLADRFTEPASMPLFRDGTTLEATIGRPSAGGYQRLVVGPAQPAVLRTDLARPRSDMTTRETRRTPLAALVQVTDLHITDVQNPLRFEYLDHACRSAYRPQELLGTQGATAMVSRINGLRGGPFTGRPLDAVVSTGDATDNQCGLELEWLMTILAGGEVTPSSGAPSRFEGVADVEVSSFWQPEGSGRDDFSRQGFPQVPGLLLASTATFRSPGLDVPWLLTMGNHDNTTLGTLPDQPQLVEWCLGDRKVISARTDEAHLLGARLEAATAAEAPRIEGGAGALLAALAAKNPTITVTPDERRAPFTAEGYLAAARDPRFIGAGPFGHGYDDDSAAERLYFTHRLNADVVLISLDTTNQAGGAQGSIGAAQLAWLDEELTRHRRDYVIVTSHHPSASMGNLMPDPRVPGEVRYSGQEVLAVLGRHAHVVAWVNGHTHRNRITAHRRQDPRNSFWEICTASHVDAPQQSRVIEVARNGDGTVSLFTTLLDADAPVQTAYDDLSTTGLASLYRELAFNDLQLRERRGSAEDQNTELLLLDPFV